MDFAAVLARISDHLQRLGHPVAVIGGVALAALRSAASPVAGPGHLDLARLEPPRIGSPPPARRSNSAGWAPFRLVDEAG